MTSQKFGNDQAAIEALIARAGQAADSVRWAINLISPLVWLLIMVLLAVDQTVTYVPERVVNSMTGSFRGQCQTDATDARMIAQCVRLCRDLAPVVILNELVVGLTWLTSYRTDPMADWVGGTNRLRAMLGSIFLALEAVFDFTNWTPLVLLAGLDTPAEIRADGIDGVTPYLTDNDAWKPGVVQAAAAVDAAGRQRLALSGETATTMPVKRIARKVLDLDREIKDTDKLITTRFRRHPSARIIESQPSIAPGLEAEFPFGTGGNPATFAHAGRLASNVGLGPARRDFGRVSGNLHRSKRYNRCIRRVFYKTALSSLRYAKAPSRRFCDRKRGERLIHVQALLALARRFVDVLWTLLRDGREFSMENPTPAV